MSHKTAVFYFNFSFDDESERACGFIFDPTILPDDYINESLYEEVTYDIEEKFGVHDWCSSPSGILAIAYTSYEITDVEGCMNAWHDKFVELVGDKDVSKWVEFNPNYLDDDDLAIYNKIKSLV